MKSAYPSLISPFVKQGLFDSRQSELIKSRKQAKLKCCQYQANPTSGNLQHVKQLLSSVGDKVFIEPGFFCDYGVGIELGDEVYLNLNVLLLDAAFIRIGAKTLIGPNVQIISVGHPIDAELRSQGLSTARPVTIGEKVWIGAGAIILPGVTVGNGANVGAGSIVTANVPPGETWAGNPAKRLGQVP